MTRHSMKGCSATLLQMSICLFSLLITSTIFAAEEPKAKDNEKGQVQTFKILADLVSVNVSVTDKGGNPVKNLTQSDFQILEDGVPQEITVFRVEAALGVVVAPATPSRKGEAVPGAKATPPSSRKVIFFVDDYHLDFPNLVRLKKEGENFIRNGLQPRDLIALITASGKNSTEFTKYREYVIQNLNNISSLGLSHRPVIEGDACPSLSTYQIFEINRLQMAAGLAFSAAVDEVISCGADNLQKAQEIVLRAAQNRAFDISEFVYDSRRTLYSLQMLAKRLRAIEGPKILVFLSDGFLTRDLEFQIQDVIDAAVRANTVIHSINTIGLEATPPGGNASSSFRTRVTTIPSHVQLEYVERVAKEEVLNALAADTGGSFLRNSNHFSGQLNTALSRSQMSYFMGYYSTNPQHNGKFRKIAVKVNRRDVIISARKGYYAPKGDEAFEAQKNEDIQEALQSSEEFKDIPIAVSYNITHTASSRSQVAVQTQIDVRKIRFQKRENRNRDVFTIVTVVYDANNRFVAGKETRIDFNLTDPNYRDVMHEGLLAQTSFSLDPGNYKIKSVVREAGETKLGSVTKDLEILN